MVNSLLDNFEPLQPSLDLQLSFRTPPIEVFVRYFTRTNRQQGHLVVPLDHVHNPNEADADFCTRLAGKNVGNGL